MLLLVNTFFDLGWLQQLCQLAEMDDYWTVIGSLNNVEEKNEEISRLSEETSEKNWAQ